MGAVTASTASMSSPPALTGPWNRTPRSDRRAVPSGCGSPGAVSLAARPWLFSLRINSFVATEIV